MATPYSNERRRYARYTSVGMVNASNTEDTSATKIRSQRENQDQSMLSEYRPKAMYGSTGDASQYAGSGGVGDVVPQGLQRGNEQNIGGVVRKPIIPLVSLHTREEQAAFVKSAPLTVIYVYGDDCIPCKTIGPQVQELAEKLQTVPHVAFAKENGMLFLNKEITAVPSFIVYTQGQNPKFYMGDYEGMLAHLDDFFKHLQK